MSDDAAAASPPRRLQLERAVRRGDRLAFASAERCHKAMRDGCFLLEIPADLDLSPGLALSRQFYRDAEEPSAASGAEAIAAPAYRGFRQRPGVYFDREHFQTEHVLLDRPARVQHFPAELVAMCDRMNELGLVVLRSVLAEVGIAPELWRQVTGGAVDDEGTHWFASSHYRPERDLLGCAPHKDTGFATILYIDQEGLEAWVDGAWVSVDPEPGHFIVNFGGSLEILTRHTATPVRAILHRVRQTFRGEGVEDRFSFAAFVNPPPAEMLYECDAQGRARPYQRVEEFLVEFNKETWKDRHDDFGIRS